MEITVEQIQGRVPVTVLGLQGELDASCYLDVIAKAKELYRTGVRNLLLDLSDLSFMASSGLVALHSIVLLMRGEEPPDPEAGWGAFHAIAEHTPAGFEAHCKLLNPQPRINRTLGIAGFKTYLEVYTDPKLAIASF